MLLFKTSGATYDSVIKNQKHAFKGMPQNWYSGELVLVSKNKADCGKDEKQIQYVMRLTDIRPLKRSEADSYWPGNEGRWKYLVECSDTMLIRQPFNLVDLLGDEYGPYAHVMTFMKIRPSHETIISSYLKKVGMS
jgi:hypothetical protein